MSVVCSFKPGWFYDFPDEAWVVVSLLTPPQTLSEGFHQIVASVAAADGRSINRGR